VSGAGSTNREFEERYLMATAESMLRAGYGHREIERALRRMSAEAGRSSGRLAVFRASMIARRPRPDLTATFGAAGFCEFEVNARREKERGVAVCDNANIDCASPVHHVGSIRRLSTAPSARRNPVVRPTDASLPKNPGLWPAKENRPICRDFLFFCKKTASPVHHAIRNGRRIES
jgi:hypothetical protein